jgi:hypothetical protein
MSLPPLENDINLPGELRALLTTCGHWIVVRKFFKFQKCSCRRQRSGDQPSPECPLCGGRGHPYREYPIRAYSMSKTLYKNIGAATRRAMFGAFEEEGRIYLALPETRVAASDTIYEVRLDENERILLPLDRLAVFNVSTVDLMRGDRSGAVDFLVIHTGEQEGAL